MDSTNTFIQNVPLEYFIILSTILFSLGVLGVLLRKNEDMKVVIIIDESNIKNIYKSISNTFVFLFSFFFESFICSITF